MSKLYSELALIYHEMYQSIFDYEKEYRFYKNILDRHHCSKILEVGCGSGNLSSCFIDGGFDYTGADLSEEMLAIARENNPGIRYLHKDMRDLGLKELYDGILITGRSFTYMNTNADVSRCLASMHEALKHGGILVFDNFNAEGIFLDFRPHMEQESEVNGRSIKRISNNSRNLETGWTWNWHAAYIISEAGKETRTIEDKSVLRAFTQDEISLFLRLNGFDIVDIMSEATTLTAVAIRK